MRLYKYKRSEAPFKTGDIIQLKVDTGASIYIEGSDKHIKMNAGATFVVYRTYGMKKEDHGYNLIATYPDLIAVNHYRIYPKDARKWRILGQHFGKKVKNKPST